MQDVKGDVEAFYKAAQAKSDLDMIRLLTTRSESHLNEVFAGYTAKYAVSMSNMIKKQFAGQMQTAFVSCVDYVDNRGLWFAKQFKSAMAGAGMVEDKLIRLILRLRATPLMQVTKDAYQSMTGKALDQRIADETTGDHQKLIVALVNQPAL